MTVDATGHDLFWDEILTLPESAVPEDRFRMMYTFLVEKLKTDVEGSPMKSLDWLILERTAAKYVTCRVWESQGITTTNPGVMDKLESGFLSLAALMSKNIQKVTPAEERARINDEVAKAIKSVLSEKIKNPELRKELLSSLAAAL